uniref:Doublecortin domain-containing protein n=1 Tax=Denticeps clupeoides TaxID=299321 RepID=A0AAY4ALG1_9TELE
VGTAELSPAPPKTVVVYRNGDVFYPGRKFVINQRTATFESFLGNVTSVIEAPFGAVRNLYTSREGHRILDLDQLEHGESYVAAGRERFKQLDYRRLTDVFVLQIQPVAHSRIVVSARWKNIVIESCTINVFTNGGSLVPPARIMIPKYTLRSWENVLAMVTEKVRLRTGAVQRLCRLDGTIVLNAGELENNQYYVAVGAEKFRWLPYFPWVPNKASTRDHSNGSVKANQAVREKKWCFCSFTQRIPSSSRERQTGKGRGKLCADLRKLHQITSAQRTT